MLNVNSTMFNIIKLLSLMASLLEKFDYLNPTKNEERPNKKIVSNFSTTHQPNS